MRRSSKVIMGFVVLTLVSIVIISRFARYEFHKESRELLDSIGMIKRLEYDAGFRSEIALAL